MKILLKNVNNFPIIKSECDLCGLLLKFMLDYDKIAKNTFSRRQTMKLGIVDQRPIFITPYKSMKPR